MTTPNPPIFNTDMDEDIFDYINSLIDNFGTCPDNQSASVWLSSCINSIQTSLNTQKLEVEELLDSKIAEIQSTIPHQVTQFNLLKSQFSNLAASLDKIDNDLNTSQSEIEPFITQFTSLTDSSLNNLYKLRAAAQVGLLSKLNEKLIQDLSTLNSLVKTDDTASIIVSAASCYSSYNTVRSRVDLLRGFEDFDTWKATLNRQRDAFELLLSKIATMVFERRSPISREILKCNLGTHSPDSNPFFLSIFLSVCSNTLQSVWEPYFASGNEDILSWLPQMLDHCSTWSLSETKFWKTISSVDPVDPVDPVNSQDDEPGPTGKTNTKPTDNQNKHCFLAPQLTQQKILVYSIQPFAEKLEKLILSYTHSENSAKSLESIVALTNIWFNQEEHTRESFYNIFEPMWKSVDPLLSEKLESSFSDAFTLPSSIAASVHQLIGLDSWNSLLTNLDFVLSLKFPIPTLRIIDKSFSRFFTQKTSLLGHLHTLSYSTTSYSILDSIVQLWQSWRSDFDFRLETLLKQKLSSVYHITKLELVQNQNQNQEPEQNQTLSIDVIQLQNLTTDANKLPKEPYSPLFILPRSTFLLKHHFGTSYSKCMDFGNLLKKIIFTTLSLPLQDQIVSYSKQDVFTQVHTRTTHSSIASDLPIFNPNPSKVILTLGDLLLSLLDKLDPFLSDTLIAKEFIRRVCDYCKNGLQSEINTLALKYSTDSRSGTRTDNILSASTDVSDSSLASDSDGFSENYSNSIKFQQLQVDVDFINEAFISLGQTQPLIQL